MRVLTPTTEAVQAQIEQTELPAEAPDSLIVVAGVISVGCGHEVYDPHTPSNAFPFLYDPTGTKVQIDAGAHGVLLMSRAMAQELADAISATLLKTPEAPLSEATIAQIEQMGFKVFAEDAPPDLAQLESAE